MGMMRTIISGIIVFATAWFAVTNAAPVNINAFFWNIDMSAAVVVLGAFALGFVLGVVRVAPSWLRTRAQASTHHKELQVCLTESKESAARVQELEVELAAARKRLAAPETTDAA